MSTQGGPKKKKRGGGVEEPQSKTATGNVACGGR